jgi:hypothetical protein
MEKYVGGLIILAVALLLIMLVCRELVCWYWKINRRMVLMEEQTRLLRQLVESTLRIEEDSLAHQAAQSRQQASAPPPVPRAG